MAEFRFLGKPVKKNVGLLTHSNQMIRTCVCTFKTGPADACLPLQQEATGLTHLIFDQAWDLYIVQMNAEFQRITTHPLETTFMARLDSLQPQLTSVFQKKGGVTGQKLAKHLQILQEAASDVHSKRAAVLRALCLYLGEDDGHLIHEYTDIEGNAILTDMQKWAMGIYVISKENGDPGHYDDIGSFVGGVIILDNTGSAAQACAVMLGVTYTLNLAYPKELRHCYEFIQKGLMMDGEKLSPRILGLKNKIIIGL